MNIFITGASGFIGSHLKEYLTNRFTYTLFCPTSKELNLSNEKDVDKFVDTNNIDIIIHCANKGGGRNTADMKNITEYNLRMFFNIAKQEKKVKKIINFGSGAEYSKYKPIINVKENDSNLSLSLDEYGFYKAITSKYIEKSENLLQLRIFGCFGEYENYLLKFISNAIVKNIFHLPIVINKNVYFDYIYIDDLMKIISYFIVNDSKYKIYNATTGKKIDLITLTDYVNVSSDFKSKIIILNNGLNDEYSSNNKRLLNEIDDLKFTSHQNAIIKMRKYFLSIKDKLDIKMIKKDPYLEKCNNFWKIK